MTRINQRSIIDQVREILQRDIEAGRMKPGERIFEDALAKDLGISKTPLRLALHQLKQDGIIRIASRQGIYVAMPTPTEILELIEMRELLEGLAARRTARKADADLIARMYACFAAFDEGNLAEQQLKFAAADHKFHRILVEACGSRELIKTLETINIRLHMNRFRAALSRRHDLRPIHREHMAIIRAIKARDARKAEALIRRHVRNVPWQTVLNELTVPAAPRSSEFVA
jgi:DNA-binding GntR family transcriptional regulator